MSKKPAKNSRKSQSIEPLPPTLAALLASRVAQWAERRLTGDEPLSQMELPPEQDYAETVELPVMQAEDEEPVPLLPEVPQGVLPSEREVAAEYTDPAELARHRLIFQLERAVRTGHGTTVDKSLMAEAAWLIRHLIGLRLNDDLIYPDVPYLGRKKPVGPQAPPIGHSLPISEKK